MHTSQKIHRARRGLTQLLTAALLATLLAGCAANPVTGRPELRLFSDRNEVCLGIMRKARSLLKRAPVFPAPRGFLEVL